MDGTGGGMGDCIFLAAPNDSPSSVSYSPSEIYRTYGKISLRETKSSRS